MTVRVKRHVQKKTSDYKARFSTTRPYNVGKNLRTIMFKRFLLPKVLIPEVFQFNHVIFGQITFLI